MEYGEYLSLKNSIDQVAQLNQRECAALSERLDSVPENSDEYLVSIEYCHSNSHALYAF